MSYSITLSPANGPITGGTFVTITADSSQYTNTDFISIDFNWSGIGASAIPTFVNDTTLTFTTPISQPSGFVGELGVYVTNGSASTTSRSAPFYYGTPTLSSLSPPSGSSSGGTSITLTGLNLTINTANEPSTTSVLFGSTPALSTTFVNSTTVTAVAPPGTGGSVLVTLSIEGAVSNALTYNYDIPCLCRGMKILTPQGPLPVECLKEGDLVLAPPLRTRWVPIERVFSTTLMGNSDNLPYRIPKDFFQHHVPNEDILLSPHHAVFHNGQWRLPIHIDGLQQELSMMGKEFEYYHIGLPVYIQDKLWCHNLPVDSWDETKDPLYAQEKPPMLSIASDPLHCPC